MASDLKVGFRPRSSIMITGSTGSGKTKWVQKFLENIDSMYLYDPPKDVLYCYGVDQPLYDEIRNIPHLNVTFNEGVPAIEDILDYSESNVHKLIILDDLAHHVIKSQDMQLLFTQYCHHKNLSCIFIQQNLFQQGKYSKTIAMNCGYIVLFDNVRDKMQIMCLARQIFPNKSKQFLGVFRDATKTPYGYLVIDFSPNIDDRMRLRTNIFPGETHYGYEI